MIIVSFALTVIALIAAQGIYRNWDVYRGKRTTYDAMPEHLDEQVEIDNAFPDDSQFANRKGLLGVFGRALRAWKKITKPWEAFGPQSRFWWARWRPVPTVLFAARGEGRWRMENDVTEIGLRDIKRCNSWPNWYLSRIQYWSRWHIAVQWPLQITGHIYWRKADVPQFPDRPAKDLGITRLFYVYGPIHRDADGIYWLNSFFFGGGFK